MIIEAVSYGRGCEAAVVPPGHYSGIGRFLETAVRGAWFPGLRNKIITDEWAAPSGKQDSHGLLPYGVDLLIGDTVTGFDEVPDLTTRYLYEYGKSFSRYASPCVQSICHRLMRFKPDCLAMLNDDERD